MSRLGCDGIADAGQFFGIFIRNVCAEFFFKSHDEFDLIQRVSTEIFDEFGFGSDLIFGNTELINDDFFNFVCDSVKMLIT